VNADAAILAELHRLRLRIPEVSGTVLAGTDGLLIASDLSGIDPHHLAALAAASQGLNYRFAQTMGHGALRESVVRSAGGTVLAYPAGHWALLTVLATPDVEVHLVNPEAQMVAHRLGLLWNSLRRMNRAGESVPTSPAQPPADPYAPLAVRTPMATLPAGLREANGRRPGRS
jgi:predicted regulator of Ras-like GTPase activity (Roadblock/LC7/MglB family)